MSTSAAVNEAKRLDEIKFPEFTVKLITDVFDGLIAANIRQTESYVELLKATSQNVTEFVNNTKDDIDGEMILQYLSGIISDPAKVAVNSSLTTEEAKAVTDAIAEVPGDKVTVSAGTISQSIYEQILEAIAKRIAMDKYTMLKEMVKLGILRLVVETGVIETKLTFKTYGNNYYYNNASRYNRSSTTISAGARTGWFTSLWCKAAAATRTTSIGISTASNTSTSSSGSSVEIFGRVQINFKTDYQPLLSTTT